MLTDVRQLAPSVDALLAGAGRRQAFLNRDGRSAATFERVWIDDVPHIVKFLHPDHDFAMRVSGDVGSRAARAWAAGLLDAAPDLVDHTIVGAALGHGRDGLGAALLMRDVTDELLPLGDSTIPPVEHAALIDHLAGFSAATWGWRDDPASGPGLLAYRDRLALFGHAAIEAEQALGWPEPVPKLAAEGWRRFSERAPAQLNRLVDGLRRDATPLVRAVEATPSCLLHGDVKSSNSGVGADGRTIFIDWDLVGAGPACHDLAWHLALDRARLPVSKEDAAAAFRAALEHYGIDTSPWWKRQLSLCLLGVLVVFGWEKALGDDDEFAWWCDAARDGAAFL